MESAYTEKALKESREHLEKWSENMAHELGLDVIRWHIKVVLDRLRELEAAGWKLSDELTDKQVQIDWLLADRLAWEDRVERLERYLS